MSKKTILIVVSIATLLLILFAKGWLTLQVGSNEFKAQQKQIFSGQLMNVTGVLLMTPGGETFDVWQRTVGQSRSIDFWLYSFTEPNIIKSFQRLARSGVKIRGIMENEMYGSVGDSLEKLKDKFTGRFLVNLKSDKALGTNFQHAKTFIMDDAVIIQTANLGYAAFFNNREFFFLSHDLTIRENLKMLFQKDWQGETIKADEIHPNVLFCPIDCRFKIETIISGAKASIWMYQQYIQDEHIMDMLMQRSGLDLKFIVADNDSKEELIASPLSQFTHFRKKPYVHAKIILVDDTYLIVSSINMSSNSMDKNREIGIVIIDSFIIEQFKQKFERDWQK